MTQPTPRAERADANGSASIDWASQLATHDRWLRTVVFARLRDPQGVDEVMQEIATAAFAQRAPLADSSKLAPWLYRLAVRQALLHRRRLGRGRKLIDRYAQRARPSEGDSRETDPLDWLIDREQAQLVRAALSRLLPRDAEILLLKYAHDFNYHQIATHLGIGHSAVETRLHRARGRLRQELSVTHSIEARR